MTWRTQIILIILLACFIILSILQDIRIERIEKVMTTKTCFHDRVTERECADLLDREKNINNIMRIQR